MSRHLFTSESVSEGHPDKVADQISDAVLDHMLAEDPSSRVACETFVTTGMALVGGEITTDTYVEIPDIVRGTLEEIGYTDAAFGIDFKTCAVLSSIDRQSPDIAQGVDTGGAGDQGMMFGYATSETDELMPAAAILSHKIVQRLAELRKEGAVDWLRPDSKSQVTMVYEDGRPVKVDTVVVSTQHGPDVSQEEIHAFVKDHAITPMLPEALYDPSDCTFHINPTGKFVIGGPHGDAGLTGRKIIVDTYGGMGRHGGGAFSGKDATKVDRSAAYAARWAAKNVVAAGLAERCEIQLAYAIGVVQPVSVHVDTFGTGKIEEAKIVDAVREVFDFSAAGIISTLDLRKPIFRPSAAYGHFGRTVEQVERHGQTVTLFPWERTDRVDDLRTAAGA